MKYDKNIKNHMRNAYFGIPQETTPVGIYSRYLPRGSAERLSRNNGIGIIDYYPSVSLLAPPWHVLPGFVSEVKHTEFSITYKWDSSQLLQQRSFRTPVGELTQLLQSDPAGAGSEHIVEHYVKEKEDYKIMQYIIENTIFSSNEQDFKKRVDYLGDDGVVLSRLDRSGYQKLMLELVGPERFLLDFFDFPELISSLIETIDERGNEQLQLVLNQGNDLIWQPDNISADMTPPTYFEEYHLPLYKERVKKIKDQNDGRYIVHIDGKSKALSTSLKSCEGLILESFSLPCIGGDVELDQAPTVFSGHRVFPNLPSNWCELSDQEFIQHSEKMKKDFMNLGYPSMLQVSEDLPEYAYMRILPMLSKVFNS